MSAMAAVETRTVDADEAEMRLDRWFREHYPQLSFGHLQKLIRSGQVRVDGAVELRRSTRLGPGMTVRVGPHELRLAGPPASPTP